MEGAELKEQLEELSLNFDEKTVPVHSRYVENPIPMDGPTGGDHPLL